MDQAIGLVIAGVVMVGAVLWLVRKAVYTRFERGVLLVFFGLVVLGIARFLAIH